MHNSRREWIGQGALAMVGIATNHTVAAEVSKTSTIGYCLNTSTISGQQLDIIQLVEMTAKSGYNAIEPWIRDLDKYIASGGNLDDLGKRIADKGLTVESSIAFAEWIVDDPSRRKKGLEQAKRDMDKARRIGAKRIAAPPVGATNQVGLNPLHAAERYRELLEIGDQIGIVAMVELWGFSKCLSRIGEVFTVAAESRHPKACMLLDTYHLYKGGSDFSGIRLLDGKALPVIHFNDYPAQPPRESIADAQRIYPGDGIAPLKALLNDLRLIRFSGFLSLELFNRDYWKLDPLVVAETGLRKMKAVVEASA